MSFSVYYNNNSPLAFNYSVCAAYMQPDDNSIRAPSKRKRPFISVTKKQELKSSPRECDSSIVYISAI